MFKTIFSYIILITGACLILSTTGCKKDDDKAPAFAGIEEFSPAQGSAGTQVLINGEHFPLDTSRVHVTINGVYIPIVRSNEEQLLVQIPKNKAIGIAPIVVTIDGKTTVTTKVNFSYIMHQEFYPSASGFGTDMQIAAEDFLVPGQKFPTSTSSLSVTINGITIPVKSVTTDTLTVTIPKDRNIGVAPVVIAMNGNTVTSTGNFEYLLTRTVTTLAGTGVAGYKNGAGNQAQFEFYNGWEARRGGIDVDDNLNVYVADAGNQCIRKIAPDGTVSTVAGNPGAAADWGINWRNDNGGAGSYNAVIRPTDVKIDSRGNMYVCDDWQGCLVMFEPDGKAHYLGWGGDVNCIAVDEANNTLYLNSHNGGTIYTSAMNSYGPNVGNQKVQVITGVQWGAGMVVDKRNGDLYFVYHDAQKILKYARGAWSSPVVIAGNGSEGYADGAASAAKFSYPWGIAMDATGNLYVGGNGTSGASSNPDQSIRFIQSGSWNVSTFAGSGTSGYVDGKFYIKDFTGLNSADNTCPIQFNAPTGVAVDKNGAVYVLDRGNNVVRKIVTE